MSSENHVKVPPAYTQQTCKQERRILSLEGWLPANTSKATNCNACNSLLPGAPCRALRQGGLHRGGRGGGRPPPPPNLSIGGALPPPNFGLQYKGVPKSPLLSLFCNSVYWLKPHNNVNSRPPNLAVLPPPLYGTHSLCIGTATAAAEAGVPVDTIKAMGKWTSECYHYYTQSPHKALANLASKLCGSQP